MGQLDLFDDFLMVPDIISPQIDWDGADHRLLKIQQHPGFAKGELIAYQGIKSIFGDKEIFSYFAILKDYKNSGYPYHLGSFKPDLSGTCYDCIRREYQLNNTAFWRQKPFPEGSPAAEQWTDWFWKNEDERGKFTIWLNKLRARNEKRQNKVVVQVDDEQF